MRGFKRPGKGLPMSSNASEIAIRVENLGKCYQIYNRPSDRLRQFVVPRVQRQLKRPPTTYYRDFWAVQDLSFEIRRGDTMGIIGRNGSGKSTLLQIICGTLTPTTGRVDVNGRVAALLELGAGFNPEFTGRENVYLNGALYGLNRDEVDARIDAISSFADIGSFMDQPVKTYSSGMYVRLAFAVIAHVDADILVVDEALAVGDAVFTQKCMRFIRRFQENGTLLFVSHDSGAVQNLCAKAMWLHKGVLQDIGPAKGVVERYTKYTLQEIYGSSESLTEVNQAPDAPDPAAEIKSVAPVVGMPGETDRAVYSSQFRVAENPLGGTGFQSGKARIEDVRLENIGGQTQDIFEGGEKIRLVIRARADIALTHPIIGFYVTDRLGQELFGENTLPFTGDAGMAVQPGQSFSANFDFTLPMLPNGQYAVTASVAHGTLVDHVQHHWMYDILLLHVTSSKVRWGLVGLPFDDVRLQLDSN